MRAKTIQDTINEWGGAGYAVYGGAANYGNPGRGIGFGQSSANKGGPNLMYTYDVKDLNQALQTKPTPQSDEKYVHIGLEVKAKSMETKKWIQGTIVSAKEDSDGNILHYEVLNPKTGQNEKVDPSSVELVKNDMQPGLATLDRDLVGESFVSESLEELNDRQNFERGIDPKIAMDLGLNKRILAEKLVKILNKAYFENQPGTPTVTWAKSGKNFKDTDGGNVSFSGMIKWAKEMLTDEDYTNEMELTSKEIQDLLNDIKIGRIAHNFPMDKKIEIYSSMFPDEIF